jgi:hypothetical protein
MQICDAIHGIAVASVPWTVSRTEAIGRLGYDQIPSLRDYNIYRLPAVRSASQNGSAVENRLWKPNNMDVQL